MNLPDLKSYLKIGERNIPMGVIVGIGCFMLVSIIVMSLQIDRARSRFYEARKELELYRNEVWQLDRLNEPAAHAELKEELAKFSSGKNVANFVEQITATGKKFGITFDSISPRAKTDLNESERKLFPNLARVPIDMIIRGTHQNISVFLSTLGKLDQMVVRVDEFRLLPPNSESDFLKGPVSLSVFIPQDDDKSIDSQGNGTLSLELRNMGKTRFREFGRNPFKEWAEPAGNVDLVLEGIMYDEKQPVVLINGKIWQKGAQVGNVKIVDIQQTSIVIEKDGKQETIRLRIG